MGEVTLTYDDDRTTRAALLEAMARGGFHETPAVAPRAEYGGVHHRFTTA